LVRAVPSGARRPEMSSLHCALTCGAPSKIAETASARENAIGLKIRIHGTSRWPSFACAGNGIRCAATRVSRKSSPRRSLRLFSQSGASYRPRRAVAWVARASRVLVEASRLNELARAGAVFEPAHAHASPRTRDAFASTRVARATPIHHPPAQPSSRYGRRVAISVLQPLKTRLPSGS
jgi:hypothetical protein